MQSQISLECSHEPHTSLYTEAEKIHNLFSSFILILSLYLRIVFLSGLVLSNFANKIFYECMLPGQSIKDEFPMECLSNFNI